MPIGEQTEPFEAVRPQLLGLAYRILGSLADAEDAVQDTYLKWARADRAEIDNPSGWLTTACTRRCLDLLRAAYRTRVDYVGAWLPEPVHTPVESEATAKLELDESLTTAFLLMLERLTPKERAAYLLHDIFDVSYSEIAATLDMQESACRKLVSRAKANIDREKIRYMPPQAQQERLLSAFKAAIAGGGVDELVPLLSDDIKLTADGGGKVAAVLEVLEGKTEVLAFISESLSQYWRDHQWTPVNLNGARGFVLSGEGGITAAVSFAYDENGQATGVYIVRNPDKLANLGAVALH